MARAPWGHKKVDGVVTPIPEHLEALDKAVEMVCNESCSLREAADWVESQIGVSVSYGTIRSRMTPVQVQKYTTKSGYLNPKERQKKREEARKKALAQANKKKTNARQYAKKLKKEADTVERKMTRGERSTQGRLMSSDEFTEYDEVIQDAVEENIIFRPNPGPQEEFLAAPEQDVLFGGAAGGGKSYAFIIDPLRYAHKRGHRALLLRKSLKELRELIDKTRDLYPQIFPGAKYKESEKLWTFPSGAKLEFGYLERDSDVYQFQGQAYTWIGFDEITHLATEFAWNYLGSRLRSTDPDIELYMRCTANPGGAGHAWVKKRYVDPAPPGESFKGSDGITRRFIPALLKDNPYLATDGRYETMLKSMDEVTRARLLNGDWNIQEGAAFPEFNREVHVIQPFDIPHSWFRFKGVDYGYSAPSACLWCAVDPQDGTIIVYRELYKAGLTGEELGELLVEMEAPEGRSIPGVLDTAAWNRTGYTGPTIGEILNRAPFFLKLRPADKNRIAGKVQMHERLRPNKETGRPRMQFFSTVPNIIRELESIPLDPNRPEDVDTKAEDHAYDALRYAIMSRPRVETFDDWATKAKRDMFYSPSDSGFGY